MKEIIEQWREFLDEEIISEEEPFQRKVKAKHKRNRLTTKGKEVEEPPFVDDPPTERGKSAPPLGENNIE